MQRLIRHILTFAGCLSVLAFASIAQPLPPQEATVKELIPLASWEKQFKITAGKDRGKVVLLTSKPDIADQRKSKLVFGNYAAILLARDPNGTLMMERLELLNNRSYIAYEPALPILPGDIKSTGFIRRETGYKMYSLETGKLKRAGRVAHLVKRVSHSQFDTPAGLIEGYYIEIDHRMEMEYYSQLHITLGIGCRLDEGPIYGSGQYTVTKLGVFRESKAAAAGLAR
ncbi:MAG TPA: hypothetical protein VE689_00160 [Candidatus Udaeobacter sp.]|nr:hypothetical protein [Candidatus Udaeobacter sp.]